MAADSDGRAFRVEPQHLERIVLEVGTTVAAGLEAEALELVGDIGSTASS